MHSGKVKSIWKKKANTSVILVWQRPVPTSSPQATSWDFLSLLKSFKRKERQRMYPPLCSLLQPRSYPLHIQNSQMVSSLNSMYGQRILKRLVLWILCLENQKNSQMVSSLNSFGRREKERIKRILRWLVLWILLARERRNEGEENRIAQVFCQWTFLDKESIEQKNLRKMLRMNQKFLFLNERNLSFLKFVPWSHIYSHLMALEKPS